MNTPRRPAWAGVSTCIGKRKSHGGEELREMVAVRASRRDAPTQGVILERAGSSLAAEVVRIDLTGHPVAECRIPLTGAGGTAGGAGEAVTIHTGASPGAFNPRKYRRTQSTCTNRHIHSTGVPVYGNFSMFVAAFVEIDLRWSAGGRTASTDPRLRGLVRMN